MTTYMENPELDQDRVTDLLETFNRYGYVMFPEQKRIYQYISSQWSSSILEAGCGVGLGTYIFSGAYRSKLVGTDKLLRNVSFAKEVYPWINFEVWDIAKESYREKYPCVVCVETIEHVKDYKKAIVNLFDSCSGILYLSTPNRLRSDETRPSNPYHVREFSPQELLDLLPDCHYSIFETKNFTNVSLVCKDSPLLYCVYIDPDYACIALDKKQVVWRKKQDQHMIFTKKDYVGTL